jgi:hypothetical protein
MKYDEREQRAKDLILNFLKYDPDIQEALTANFLKMIDTDVVEYALKRTFRRTVRNMKGVPLTKSEMVNNIVRHCKPELYKGLPCLYFASEVYASFMEHSKYDIKDMLIKHKIFIKETNKRHPLTRTNTRAFVLDIRL